MINIYSVISEGVDRPDSTSSLATKFHLLKGCCRILLQVLLGHSCFCFLFHRIFIQLLWKNWRFHIDTTRNAHLIRKLSQCSICFPLWVLIMQSWVKVIDYLSDYTGTWWIGFGSWSLYDKGSCIVVTIVHGECCFASWYV